MGYKSFIHTKCRERGVLRYERQQGGISLRHIFLIAAIFINSQIGFAKILKFHTTNTKFESISFTDVCASSGVSQAPLIEVSTPQKLDCMGHKVDLQAFCRNKFPSSKTFMRGYADSEDRVVRCQFAEFVEISYKCDGGQASSYCGDATQGCERLKKIFASNLSVVQHSIETDREGKALKCHFSAESVSLETILPPVM